MKSVLGVLFVSITIFSCSKQAVLPSRPDDNSPKIFYRDANITVADMKGVQNSKSSITVSFSTLNESGINKLEIMSGSTTSTLCTIYVTPVEESTTETKTYSFEDTHLKGATMYYMIRYTSSKGNWGYTPLLTVKVQ